MILLWHVVFDKDSAESNMRTPWNSHAAAVAVSCPRSCSREKKRRRRGGSSCRNNAWIKCWRRKGTLAEHGTAKKGGKLMEIGQNFDQTRINYRWYTNKLVFSTCLVFSNIPIAHGHAAIWCNMIFLSQGEQMFQMCWCWNCSNGPILLRKLEHVVCFEF